MIDLRYVDWGDFFLNLLLGVCALLAFLLVIGLIWSIVYEAHADKFYLRKDQWTCAQSHNETNTMYVIAGQVIVPMITTSIVCDQWSRK